MSEENVEMAFACVNDDHLQEGMTLRDWFAGQALVSLTYWNHRLDGKPDNRAELATAEEAYRYADAMLKARETK